MYARVLCTCTNTCSCYTFVNTPLVLCLQAVLLGADDRCQCSGGSEMEQCGTAEG